MDDGRFRALLLPGREAAQGRLGLDLPEDDVASIAGVFRLRLEQVAALDLTKAWPNLAAHHLPNIGSRARAAPSISVVSHVLGGGA